jgi:hypothetical protein
LNLLFCNALSSVCTSLVHCGCHLSGWDLPLCALVQAVQADCVLMSTIAISFTQW